MEEAKGKWGGSRVGSGRKTQSEGPLVTIGLTVEVEVKAKLQRLAREAGMSASAYLNRLVKNL